MSRPVAVMGSNVGCNGKAQCQAPGNFQAWGFPSSWFGAQARVGSSVASPVECTSPAAGDLGGQLCLSWFGPTISACSLQENGLPAEQQASCSQKCFCGAWLVFHLFTHSFNIEQLCREYASHALCHLRPASPGSRLVEDWVLNRQGQPSESDWGVNRGCSVHACVPCASTHEASTDMLSGAID